MIDLVIADDHAIVRGGLKQIFAQYPDIRVSAEVSNGLEILALLRQCQPDLLLLDMNMPGLSGLALVQRIKQQHPDLAVLVLSMHDEPLVAARVIKAGAGGYITKDSEPELLIAAVRKVAGRGKYISPELAAHMVFDDAPDDQGLPHVLLSNRELEIFRLLAQGKSAADIAAELSISNKTVSTHKINLMEKMKLGGMAELMRYAMENGFTKGS